jgi:hypothetical protein
VLERPRRRIGNRHLPECLLLPLIVFVVVTADAFFQDRVYRHSSMAAVLDVLAHGLKDRICKAEHRHRRRLLLICLRALESSFSALGADGRLCVAWAWAEGRGGAIA